MALQEWDRAICFLEAVLTAPTKKDASQMQVEAYKKWVLAHLLAHGVVVSLDIRSSFWHRAVWLMDVAARLIAKDYQQPSRQTSPYSWQSLRVVGIYLQRWLGQGA